ncbi:MAG TPA: hypothetical protein VJ717_01180 [Gemmatimonadaceae bacterium]|nr:hypothetical protein [Gemmatimonadaceae bacterium]
MSVHDHLAPSRESLVQMIQARPVSARLKTISLVLAVVGFAIFVIGVMIGQPRAWQAFHISWLFFTIISSAGVMLAATQRITTARWSRAVIRFVEGYVAWLPIAYALLLLTLFLGRAQIFPWVTEPPTQPEKALWLNPTFWSLRAIVLLALLFGLQIWFVYKSLRVDVGVIPEWGASWAKGIRDRMRRGFGDERRELHSTHSWMGRAAVIMALMFGFFWVVMSWDLSMSLDYHFQSTMYGWQIFIGGWLGNLMVFAILLRPWRRFLAADEVITDRHYHDVGKLCFAFTAFWGYLTFGQLLVIWYGNWPEETHFFANRMSGPWLPLTLSIAILMFALPFFGLLGKFPKVFSPTMVFFALCSLTGLFIHRYIEIYPSIYLQGVTSAPFGLWEIGIFIGFLGLWGWSYLQFFDAFPRMRIAWLTSPYRDEMQVPVDPKTMEPLPAHE